MSVSGLRYQLISEKLFVLMIYTIHTCSLVYKSVLNAGVYTFSINYTNGDYRL